MNYNILNTREFYFRIFLFLFIVTLLASISMPVYATADNATSDPFQEFGCKMITITQGWIVKSICMIVIVFIGIKVMTGQVREMFVSVLVPVLGITVVLSAPAILPYVSGMSKLDCPSQSVEYIEQKETQLLNC